MKVKLTLLCDGLAVNGRYVEQGETFETDDAKLVDVMVSAGDAKPEGGFLDELKDRAASWASRWR